MRSILALMVVVSLGTSACGDDAGPAADAGPDAAPTESSTAAPAEEPSTTTDRPTTTVAPPTTAPRPTVPVPATSTLAGILALDRPLVIGHAGGDQSWPHSTMYGFVQAAAAGADVLEMDVQLSADGVLVVQHDDTVDRTTPTSGRVRDLTLEELQVLDSGYWWSEQWSSHDLPDEAYLHRGVRTGEAEPPPGFTADDFRIETFRTIAETFPDHVLDIEIKIPDGDDGEDDLEFAIEGARVLAEQIAELDRAGSVIVVSFDDDVMAAFRAMAPEVVTSPALGAMYGWIVGAELTESDLVLQIPPVYAEIEILTDEVIARAAAEGIGIWVWPNDAATQENADFYQELAERGVDGVIAGRPAVAVDRFAGITTDGS